MLRLETPASISQQSDLAPDGALIAMGGLWNGDVRMWATKNGQETRVLKGHTDVVNQAVFSPDGSKLATVSADGTARLWEDRQRNAATYAQRSPGLGAASGLLPRRGRRWLTSGTDNTLRLWDTASGEEIRRFENPLPEGDRRGDLVHLRTTPY